MPEFYQKSGLASILEGAQQGLDWKQNRQAKAQDIRLKNNADREKNSEYADTKGFLDSDPDSMYDDKGTFTGFQKQVPAGDKRIIDQSVSDMGYGGAAVPSASPGNTAPSAAPQTADQIAKSTLDQDSTPQALAGRQQARTAMIARMKAAGTLPPGFQDDSPEAGAQPPPAAAPPAQAPQDQPKPTEPSVAAAQDRAAIGPAMHPGDPKPLIVDRKGTLDLIKHRRELEHKTLENGQKALLPPGTDAVDYDPNGPKVPLSNGQNAIMAKETHVGAGPDTQVSGIGGQTAQDGGQEAGAAAGAPPSDDYSPYMMRKITDRSMTKPHDPLISVDMLPASIGDELRQRGVKSVPTSVAKTMLLNQGHLDQQAMKNQGGVGGIDPVATGLMTKIQHGEITPGEAAEEYQRQGKSLTKPVLDTFYKAANLGTAQGNQDIRRNSNALAHDRFDQTKKKEVAGVVQKASSAAVAAAKPEMDGVMDARSAKALLEAGDTNGLVGLIPMMITKAMLTQRISNQEIAATTGLQGGDDIVNQMMAKLQGEGLTDDNKKHFWKLADTLEQRHLQGIKAKTGAFMRTGLGSLQALGLDPNSAQDAMGKALDPENLVATVKSSGGRTQSGPATSGQVTGNAGGAAPGEQEMKNAKLLSMKNSTINAIRQGQRLNKDGSPMNPSQQRAAIQAIEQKFQAMTKQNLQGVQ